jgi:hypothetical protein
MAAKYDQEHISKTIAAIIWILNLIQSGCEFRMQSVPGEEDQWLIRQVIAMK